jgi:hypothetical protein
MWLGEGIIELQLWSKPPLTVLHPPHAHSPFSVYCPSLASNTSQIYPERLQGKGRPLSQRSRPISACAAQFLFSETTSRAAFVP